MVQQGEGMQMQGMAEKNFILRAWKIRGPAP